jgi:NTP pyrophosphatase (non-canonical NTP hydrolase)
MTTDNLIKSVEQWAIARDLGDKDPFRQLAKCMEELGETAGALAKGNAPELKDGIGDVVVTLIILAMQNGTDLKSCLAAAWDEIKDRKGKTVNGVFVKD